MSEQNEQLRADFEVWATGKGLALGMWGCRTQYTASWTQTAWEAVQWAARRAQPAPTVQAEPFQQRVQPWMMECFGPMIAGDREERNHRFLEESLELVQSTGCTAHEAHELVDYVFARPVGEPAQEVGGVMVTLAALCLANDLDMHECADVELARIWTKVEAIRAKQAAKPKHSPLPAAPAHASSDGRDAKDAARWRETLRHVGGSYTDTGFQRFTLRFLSPVEGADIMRGGVAEHFTHAIDAALAGTGVKGDGS